MSELVTNRLGFGFVHMASVVGLGTMTGFFFQKGPQALFPDFAWALGLGSSSLRSSMPLKSGNAESLVEKQALVPVPESL